MSTKLRSLCLVAAVTATTITVLTTGASPAAAAADTTCGPAANIFTMQADGDLWVYRHADPVNGAGSWAGATHIGNGWGGKTFAGPNGWIYNITTWGDLRRLRYNGSGWDTFPGGGQYETIGTGWQKFTESGNRGKITVAANGSIYTLEGDQLRWWHYIENTRQWAQDSGKVLDVGWSRFDVLAASGNGGLQARDSSGTLHRFRYNSFHERFQAYDVIPATRWRGYDKLFSAGGDVYYAVRPDTGQLLWNRFAEDATSNWRTASGSVIGTDWGTDVDITATTTDCTVTGLVEPLAGVRDEHKQPAAIMTPASGGTHLVSITADNTITDTHSTGSGWTTRTLDGGRYSGVSSPVSDDDAGTATFGTTKISGGAVELHTLKNGQWQAPLSLKGAMDWTPAVVRRSNGTLAVYAAGDIRDETRGHVYVREQLPGGEFLAWRAFGNPSTTYLGKPVVITRGDVTTIVMDIYGGQQRDWFRHTAGSAPVRMGTFPGTDRNVVFSGDGQGGILAFSLRDFNGVERPAVLREKADRSGFEENWQAIDADLGGEVSGNGHLDAQVLPNGTVALSVLGRYRKVLATTSVAPGSTQFHTWQQVSPESTPEFWDPLSIALTRSGDLALTATSTADHEYLWTAPVTADPAAPLQFTGGPIN